MPGRRGDVLQGLSTRAPCQHHGCRLKLPSLSCRPVLRWQARDDRHIPQYGISRGNTPPAVVSRWPAVVKPVSPVPARVWLIVALLLVPASVTSCQIGIAVYLARSIVTLEGGTTGFAWEHSYWRDDVLHEGGRHQVKHLFFMNLALLLPGFFMNR